MGWGSFGSAEREYRGRWLPIPTSRVRALHAAPNGMRVEDLRDWYKVRERVGGGVATGLAWSG
jgi:hypothetical protein